LLHFVFLLNLRYSEDEFFRFLLTVFPPSPKQEVSKRLPLKTPLSPFRKMRCACRVFFVRTRLCIAIPLRSSDAFLACVVVAVGSSFPVREGLLYEGLCRPFTPLFSQQMKELFSPCLLPKKPRPVNIFPPFFSTWTYSRSFLRPGRRARVVPVSGRLSFFWRSLPVFARLASEALPLFYWRV